MHESHQAVTVSSAYENQVMGMPSNAPKKIRDDSSKNMSMKGLKIKFPSGEKSEKGNPHAIKMGSESSVT